MDNNLEDVKKLLESSLDNPVVTVNDLTGTQDHLQLIIEASEFKEKTLLEQHQMVMDILRESLKEKIHAVQLKTKPKN